MIEYIYSENMMEVVFLQLVENLEIQFQQEIFQYINIYQIVLRYFYIQEWPQYLKKNRENYAESPNKHGNCLTS